MRDRRIRAVAAVMALMVVVTACRSSSTSSSGPDIGTGTVGSSPGAASPSTGACPGTTGSPPPGTVRWIQQRYGMSALQGNGQSGQGISVLIIAQGGSADTAAFATVANCYGVSVQLTQSVVGGGALPAAAPEPTLDAESVVMGAPNLASLQVAVMGSGGLAATFQAVEQGAYGNVDIVTMSFGGCLSNMGSTAAEQAGAAALVAKGVWLLAAAGDSGSTDCTARGPCVSPPPTTPAVNYPAADPSVLAVGGTSVPGATGPDVVWNYSPATNQGPPGTCAGGGGGQAGALPVPPWQTGMTARSMPDVSSIAGDPQTQVVLPGSSQWAPVWGTSIATPVTAGGLAAVRGALRAAGKDLTVPIGQAIWSLGASGSPALVDVTTGSNDLYAVGCCNAATGYDTASGWGTVRFDLLVSALQSSPMVGPYTPPG